MKNTEINPINFEDMFMQPKKRRKAVVTDSFGARLNKAREWSGMTQAELADKVGLGRTAITQMERRRYWNVDAQTVPGGDVVARIAQALNVSTDWLLLLTDISAPRDAEEISDSDIFMYAESNRAGQLLDSVTNEEDRKSLLEEIERGILEIRQRDQDVEELQELLLDAERAGGAALRAAMERRLAGSGSTFASPIGKHRTKVVQ